MLEVKLKCKNLKAMKSLYDSLMINVNTTKMDVMQLVDKGEYFIVITR